MQKRDCIHYIDCIPPDATTNYYHAPLPLIPTVSNSVTDDDCSTGLFSDLGKMNHHDNKDINFAPPPSAPNEASEGGDTR